MRNSGDIEIEKWLLGNKFLNFYERFPSTILDLPCAKAEEIPFIGFMIGAYFRNQHEIIPAAANIFTWDIEPETLAMKALATSKTFRRLGIGSRLMEYSYLLFNHYKIGMKSEWNTNDRGSKVVDGWAPVPFWEKMGSQFGTMENYGSSDPNSGNGIYFFANIREMAEKLSIKTTWRRWVQELNQFNKST